MAVVIDSGPITAEDRLRDVPREKWRDLMIARKYFMRTKLSYDCRCLIEFVNDAKVMFEPLGYASVEEMIHKGYELEPKEIGVAVEWLQLHPDKAGNPVSLNYVRAMAYQQANKLDEENQRPAHRPKRSDDNIPVDVITSKRKSPTGNSVAKALRVLRDKRPDIHARVLAGELTAHAGMLEAGFRKPRATTRLTTLQRIEKLLPHLTADERAQLRRLLAAENATMPPDHNGAHPCP